MSEAERGEAAQGREEKSSRGASLSSPATPRAAAVEGERPGARATMASDRGCYREVRDDRDGFAPGSLELLVSFYSGPFLFSFYVFVLNTTVKYLNEGPNKIQKL